MKSTRSLSIMIALVLVLGGLMPMALPAASSADWSKVDSRVLDQLAIHGQTRFYVILTLQADVSAAAGLRAKAEKTTYVFNALRETARQTQAPLTQYLDRQGLDYRTYYVANMIEVTGGRAAVEWLAARPDVARISVPPDPHQEPVIHYTTVQPEHVSAVEWNITRVGAPDVWAMGFHGEGMVVAGNDTGVDYTHPALVGHYRGNLGGGNFNHNYNWWGGAGSPAPVDGDGHGTHTMGTMVGDDGGANQIGMAPGAKWIACAGLGGADTVECFEFFLAPWDLSHANPDPTKAPDSINNSWYDTSGFDYRPIIQSLNAAGVAVIKSAGNWGSACNSISPPGNVPEIIATAAFAQGDTIASFSSRGPNSDYGDTILKPEVAAPGVNVRSSVPGGGYDGTYSGTSMAAPHSTGMVALIWSAAPCLRGDVPLTKQIMMDTAESKVDAQCPPFVGHPNDVWGWGVLDAQAAVQAAMGLCGGLGGLDGTVTSGGAPLEGVNVLAEGTGGFSRSDTTDVDGLYAMAVLSDTYTLTATKYGYATAVVNDVDVVTDVTTTVDIDMTPLPVHTVSGYVRDSVTNAPLAAVVEFTDAPVPPVSTNPATGFYSIEVAEGTWHLKATAPQHMPVEVQVVVSGDVTQDFALDPLPCILVVDDDQNNPDVLSYYTAALDGLGLDYNVWDVSTDGDPAAADLIGYGVVIWFTGYPYSGTFTAANEAAVAAFLDAGGNFFLSSQDYLYEFGLTSFGTGYLHIASFTSDVSQTTVTGQNVFAGLGPYALTYPFSNYSDRVNPDAQAQVAFVGNMQNAAVSYDGAAFKTAFFGYPFEALPDLAARTAVMDRLITWFGGCECDPVQDTALSWAPDAPLPGEIVTFTATAAGSEPIIYSWDFGDGGTGVGSSVTHSYAEPGDYEVALTAANGCGQETVTDTLTVLCDPVSIVDVTAEVSGCVATFDSDVQGTPPFEYAWDFGALGTSSDENPTVDFGLSGTYPYTLTVSNCSGAGTDTMTGTVTVECVPPCDEVTGVGLTVLTLEPIYTGDVVTFEVDVSPDDATVPFSYAVNGGVTQTADTEPFTFGLSFTETGTQTVTIAVWNCAMTLPVTSTLDVFVSEPPAPKFYVYLPIVARVYGPVR